MRLKFNIGWSGKGWLKNLIGHLLKSVREERLTRQTPARLEARKVERRRKNTMKREQRINDPPNFEQPNVIKTAFR